MMICLHLPLARSPNGSTGGAPSSPSWLTEDGGSWLTEDGGHWLTE